MLYNSLARPIVEYRLDVYGPQLSAQDSKRIERLRFRLAKIFPHPQSITKRKELFDYLGWLTLDSLITYTVAVTVYKAKCSMLPKYCDSFNCCTSGVVTRPSAHGDFGRPSLSLNCRKNSISYFGIPAWQELPDYVIDRS